MGPRFEIRAGSARDRPFLAAMLFEAFHWNSRVPRPAFERFQRNAEFRKLLEEWGERMGDTAVIAETGEGPIGAAWYRFWTAACHSYGFVEASVPELAMAVDREHRSGGVGRALLTRLIDTARAANVPALSLSVAPDNFALTLYESVSFRRVGVSGTSLTLLLPLSRSGRSPRRRGVLRAQSDLGS